MGLSFDCRLYLVTDRRILAKSHPAMSLEKAVKNAILGGVTLVQLREKNLGTKAFFEQAVAVKNLCQVHAIPFLINDRIDIALAVNADGVHIGQDDLPADVVRQLIGETKILGVTAKTVEQAQLAEAQGANYLGVGAVFGTTTKADAQAMSLATLTEICHSVTIPVVAIGGITADNVAQLANTGITGIAVVSGILAQQDIKQASEKFRYNMKNLGWE